MRNKVAKSKLIYYSRPRFTAKRFIIFWIGGLTFIILGVVSVTVGILVYQSFTLDSFEKAALLVTLPIGCMMLVSSLLWLLVGWLGRTSYSELVIGEDKGSLKTRYSSIGWEWRWDDVERIDLLSPTADRVILRIRDLQVKGWGSFIVSNPTRIILNGFDEEVIEAIRFRVDLAKSNQPS